MTRRRAVVTGVGVVSPLGIGTEAFWQACVAGKSGIDHVRSFDPSELPSQIAGEVVDFDPLTHMSEKMAGRTERFMQLALAASQEARANAGVDDTVEAVRVGVMLGNGSGGLPSFDRYLLRGQQQGWGAVDPLALLKVLPDVAASHLAVTMKAKGPVMTLVAACVSSTQAIGQATRLIRHGEADVVFASGTEASITPVGMSGFCLLRALSTRNDAPDKASRPFDTERDGFVIAEGAATLVVEELEHAQSRDAPILAEILGYAQTCDANHIVMPEPRGEGAARCIDLALRDAQVTRDEVDYINAHGTSTPLNDVAETRAIKSIFGERSYDIPISSIKSMVGHALGAAGAIETVAAVLTLQSGVLPPTINLHSPDPECDLDYVANQSRVHRCRTVLKNSFGFGGQNACLVLRGL